MSDPIPFPRARRRWCECEVLSEYLWAATGGWLCMSCGCYVPEFSADPTE